MLAVKHRLWFCLCVVTLGGSVLSWPDCGTKGVPTFEQFPVSTVYRGTLHPPLLRTPLERRYRTRIREAVREGVNFAGHYVLAKWGCGTGCYKFAVVDAVTGVIFDPPFEGFQGVYVHYWNSATRVWPHFDGQGRWWCSGREYRVESRLLVMEGCISNAGVQCGRTYLEMTNSGLKKLHFDPDLLPNGKVAPVW